MELTASTPPQAIRERFGVGEDERLRESEKRRRYLQTYARLLTTARPTIQFSDELRTAVTDYEDKPEITVTTRAFNQPATELRRPVFDLAVQEALVIHEIGHLRYTDINGFQDSLETVEADRRRAFARVWNTLEDGAVERQLRHRYAVATELDVLNANLLHTDPQETRRLGLFDAVLCAIGDAAIYDSGRLRRLRDNDDRTLRMCSLRDKNTFERLLPTLRETIKTVLTEPDPTVRNDRIWSFWTTLRTAVDEAEASPEGSELARLLDADGVVRTDDGPQQTRLRGVDDSRAGFGKPDDTAGRFGRETKSASDLNRTSVVRSVTRQVRTVVGDGVGRVDTDDPGRRTDTVDAEQADTTDGDHTDITVDGPADTGSSDDRQSSVGGENLGMSGDETRASYPGVGHPGRSTPEDETGPSTDTGRKESTHGREEMHSGENTHSGETETDATEQWTTAVEEAYAEELAAEATELDGATAQLAALDEYVRALDTADLDIPIRVATDSVDDRRQVQPAATRLARRLERQLQQRRRDTEHTRRRRGDFDRSRLVAAVRGQSDVFTRIEPGEDKQYTCVIVVDRSASMDGDAVTAAETGTLTLATALESVGVSVAILDIYESTVRLVKTVAETTETAHARVATGQTGGGTPLATALSVVRARFDGAANPFAIVVTDGRPDDTAAYTTTLDAVTFPVLGVYLTADAGPARPVKTDRPYFHQLAVVEEWSSLNRRLRRLTERVLF